MAQYLDGLEITFRHRGLLIHCDREHGGRIPLRVAKKYTSHRQSRRQLLGDLRQLGYVQRDDDGLYITKEAYENLEFLQPDRIGNQSRMGEF